MTECSRASVSEQPDNGEHPADTGQPIDHWSQYQANLSQLECTLWIEAQSEKRQMAKSKPEFGRPAHWQVCVAQSFPIVRREEGSAVVSLGTAGLGRVRRRGGNRLGSGTCQRFRDRAG